MAFAFDDDPVELFADLPSIEKVIAIAARENAILVSHNNEAERCLLAAAFGGWVLELEWKDTAALAARMSLPRSLAELTAFFWPDDPEFQKSDKGHRVMMRLCRPRKAPAGSEDLFWTPETAPEEFKQLYEYCIRDVEVMRRVHREKLIELEPREHAIWQMTERMNRRGVALDMPAIPVAQRHINKYASALTDEFVKITGCLPKSPVKVAEYLGLPDARRVTIRKALRNPKFFNAPAKFRALQLLQKLSGSAVSKVDAMANHVSSDGRLRGAFIYCGAERTARWSSWGVQLQNMRRGLGKGTDLAFMALMLDALELVYDGSTERPPPDPALDPLSIIGEMLRGFLIGPFQVGDFAQIEARVLAWFADQEDLLQTFRDKGDPYCEIASKIYGREITKADKMERFLGKQVRLGCGYQMGHKRFREMLDEIYDVEISEEFAKKVIGIYRSTSSKIVQLWGQLERGFRHAVAVKANRIQVGKVFMGTKLVAGELFAYIELPSTRKLWYAHPSLHTRGSRTEVRYFGRDIFRGGKWGEVVASPGRITENIVQAFSRDLLADAMLRLDAAGYELEGTVHDEVIAKLDDRPIEEFQAIMEAPSPWAPGLPISAECLESFRYRK